MTRRPMKTAGELANWRRAEFAKARDRDRGFSNADIPAGFEPKRQLMTRNGKPAAECFVSGCRRPWSMTGAFCLDHWLLIPDSIQRHLEATLTPAWRDRLDRRDHDRIKPANAWSRWATAALVQLDIEQAWRGKGDLFDGQGAPGRRSG